VFELLDKDGGGSIDAGEIHAVMKDLDIDVTRSEIENVLKELDSDGNGEIDFDEFLYAMSQSEKFIDIMAGKDKHYIFGDGGAKKISEQFNIPFLGEIPLNSGIMSGSDLGKPIMISSPDSPSAEAFRVSAKNIAAQCSILAAKLQQEMASEENTESAPEASTSN